MNQILFLTGPTAVGKTETSLAIVRNLPCEIISADSMQVYRHLNVGTAKPSSRVLQEIPHHLIDCIDPSEEFSVFDFHTRALQAVEEILKRGKLPLIVGGAGLYLRALIKGLAPQPGRDENLRETFAREAEAKGMDVLFARLKEIDPQAASRIHPGDQRRIVRALEIHAQSGKSPSLWKEENRSLEKMGYRYLLLGLMRERAVLYQRAEERVDQMMKEGLLEEVKRLDRNSLSRTMRQAVGYKELLLHLQGGARLDDAVALIKKNTRHLIKKQLTWFRANPEIEWYFISEDSPEREIQEQILQRMRDWIR